MEIQALDQLGRLACFGAGWFFKNTNEQNRDIVASYHRTAALELKALDQVVGTAIYSPINNGFLQDNERATPDLTVEACELFQQMYNVCCYTILLLEKYNERLADGLDYGDKKKDIVSLMAQARDALKNKTRKKLFGTGHMSEDEFWDSMKASDKLLLPLLSILPRRVMLLHSHFNDKVQYEEGSGIMKYNTGFSFLLYSRIVSSHDIRRLVVSPKFRQEKAEEVIERKNQLRDNDTIAYLRVQYGFTEFTYKDVASECLEDYVQLRRTMRKEYEGTVYDGDVNEVFQL